MWFRIYISLASIIYSSSWVAHLGTQISYICYVCTVFLLKENYHLQKGNIISKENKGKKDKIGLRDEISNSNPTNQ